MPVVPIVVGGKEPPIVVGKSVVNSGVGNSEVVDGGWCVVPSVVDGGWCVVPSVVVDGG